MPTKIQWTDESWNPLRAKRCTLSGWACVRVSQGCTNCYAATFNKRLGTRLDYTVPAMAQVETYLDEAALAKPLHWRKPRRVFVCSMTDLFGEWVTDAELDRVFLTMASAYMHTFQVLTKRPERMRRYINEVPLGAQRELAGIVGWPLPNVWLGTSVEDQKAADERIPRLLETTAAVRFLSCEPLLGPVDLDVVHGHHWTYRNGIQWVIVGGESGPRARPMDLAWARSLVAQCRAAGVAVFVKQLGSCPILNGPTIDMGADPEDCRVFLRDRKGGDPEEWPEDLRVREFPAR